MQKHVQCKLKHHGGATDIIWVPEAWAVKGKVLKRKIDGAWVDGWLVVDVYVPAQDSQVILRRANDHRHHRKATDV